ncbi:30S ribosomal protein S18 [bacterium]|nr:30S ribosomal protein S18 [bacterium]
MRKKLRKRSAGVKRQCRFTSDSEVAASLDYKNVDLLKQFLTERGKILPSRVSGNSAFYQRLLSRHIKLSRAMALLPYCSVLKQ